MSQGEGLPWLGILAKGRGTGWGHLGREPVRKGLQSPELLPFLPPFKCNGSQSLVSLILISFPSISTATPWLQPPCLPPGCATGLPAFRLPLIELTLSTKQFF